MAAYSMRTACTMAACCLLATLPARAATETVVYAFQGGSDGANPLAGLINVGGTLYGTTNSGGANCAPSGVCGTVFSVTPAGAEAVVHSFGGSGDGAFPSAGLIEMGGKLFGTTEYGGTGNCTSGCGTVFMMTKTGTEKTLYSFQDGSDGAHPTAGLTNVGGNLYGTTSVGGANGWGTVFTITPTGTEKLLYAFKGAPDAGTPEGSLIEVGGVLYGTTAYGGKSTKCRFHGRCGTVFSVTPAGTESVVYSFQGGGDGTYPYAGLIAMRGMLYGTTEYGGLDNGGTVFSVTPSGTETVMHSFQGGSDGLYPVASLINVDGALYGTTYAGGGGAGFGTVFKITKTGLESVLYSFPAGMDGYDPAAGLINVGGSLYGTTQYGGGTNNAGIVFSVKP